VLTVYPAVSWAPRVRAHELILTGRQSHTLATIGLSVRQSVRPSVRPPHAGIVSKPRKLRSRNLHRRIAQGL